jgi:Bacterial regulatory proteins, luxR family
MHEPCIAIANAIAGGAIALSERCSSSSIIRDNGSASVRSAPCNVRRNREIALRRNLTQHTVRNYLIRIFDKLGISGRVELVLYAFSGTEGNAAPENPKTFVASV